MVKNDDSWILNLYDLLSGYKINKGKSEEWWFLDLSLDMLFLHLVLHTSLLQIMNVLPQLLLLLQSLPTWILIVCPALTG